MRRALCFLVLLAPVVAGCGDHGGAPGSGQAPPELTTAADAAPAEPSLRVAAPQGVLDERVTGPFAAASGCAVVPVPSSVDAAPAALGGNDPPDVALVAGDAVAKLADARRIAALAGPGAPDVGEVAGQLAKAPGLTVDGTRRALPAAWSLDLIAAAPGTAAPPALIDLFPAEPPPRTALPDDPGTLADLLLAIGVGDPYAATPEQLTAATRLAAAAQAGAGPGYRGADELVRRFRAGRATAALAALPDARALVAALPAVSVVLPAGATTGSVTAWVAAARPAAPVCVARWLAWAASADGQAAVAGALGLLPAAQSACALLPPATCTPLGVPWSSALAAVRLAREPDGGTTAAEWRAAWQGTAR